MKTKTIKKWLGRTFITIILILLILAVNLIWFKPFSIEHFYNRAFVKVMLHNPEMVTQLDVPILYGLLNDKLTDESDAAVKKRFNIYKEEYKTLQKYNRKNLSENNKLNSDILSWYLKNQVNSEPYLYHNYTNNHKNSPIITVTRVLQEFHKLNSKSDVKAYLKRLSLLEKKINEAMLQDNLRAEKNIMPPKFILDKTIGVVENIIGDSAEVKNNMFYTVLKTAILEIKELSVEQQNSFLTEAESLLKKEVIPAYIKYKNHLVNLQSKTNNNAGVWKLPNGDSYYKYCLESNTTTKLEPHTIHEIGLKEVNRIQAEMEQILKSSRYADSTKTMKQLMKQMAIENGKITVRESAIEKEMTKKTLTHFSKIVADSETTFNSYFNIRPKTPVVVKSLPEFMGASANNQYRFRTGQGIFYINTFDAESKDTIYHIGDKSLTYHEAIPGHHFQIAIQRELKNVPRFRTYVPFTAYSEGWALYSEQLAFEAGMYDNDPTGNLGRLWSEKFRAVRLVVDTGIHFKKWTREEAITYMMDQLLTSRTMAEEEVDRYIVYPGQACAYKVGQLKILELRQKAKNTLDTDFDIKEFHDVVLKQGAVPLEILERFVNDYIVSKK